ncbi:type IV pilus modification protein PilV [uncultured Umboniibacter sp.]|uniref:type IV pilus modification protein PilV n=1 Tax=uncultured Umboniibacter sp. TaxID=1798917 RepID=UPI00261FAE5B|nr:type IV pilus modification protein PilV [uncultured Umboniibacter sp.]
MRNVRGFSLIEFVVALFVTAVAIFGFVALQGRSQLAALEVLQRDEALRLAQNMAEYIQGNAEVAGCYAFSSNGTAYVGTGYSGTITCGAFGTISSRAQPERDLVSWSNALKGQLELDGTTAVGSLVDARGCVYGPSETYDASGNLVSSTDFYEIVVAYQGASATIVPSATCGDGLYGTDTFRRAVRLYVRLAELDG